jgi:nondiscriminating aspartyl-tRNA synthetase
MDFYKAAGTEPIGNEIRTHFSSEITAELDGKEVVLMGWTHILRDKGKIKFLILRDEHGTVQVTIPQKKVSEDVFKTSELLKQSPSLVKL